MHHSLHDTGMNLIGWLFVLAMIHTYGLHIIAFRLLCIAEVKVCRLFGWPVYGENLVVAERQNSAGDTRQYETDELSGDLIVLNPRPELFSQSSGPKPRMVEAEQVHRLNVQLRLAETKITALQMQLDGIDALKQRNRELHHQVRALEDTLATITEIPEGRLVLRGRLVDMDRHLAIIPRIGRPFKVLKTPTWEYAGSTGDEVILEATWNTNGWEAWVVQLVKLATDLEPLDKSVLEKLTTVKKKEGPAFDSLDLDAIQNATRTASHSKSAVSLHIVLPTKARFSLTEVQAVDLKDIVINLVEELDLGHLEAIEIGHTEGGRQRDHLHLLVSGFNHAGKGIGEQVGRLKALSSGRLRRLHRDLPAALWSASYWVSSAGGGSLDKVREYVINN